MGYTLIDGIQTRVLLDDGSQSNSITLAFAKAQGLAVGPLEELAGDAMGNAFQGIGRSCTAALQYMIFRAQIKEIPSYDQEKVALVIEDDSNFSHKVW